MISIDNVPNHAQAYEEDFTEAHYRQLLRIAKGRYIFASYSSIPWGERFILWRHDLDFSINRAAVLAGIEAEEGVTATYFVNPCSEYYNPFEPNQVKLVKHILRLGHELGLHFDAGGHDIQNEDQLHRKVAEESRWLEEAFGVQPAVFSFHHPAAAHLQCDSERYGGLINSYSRRLKEEVPYCSDSNGYWRFRRLHDVLTEATDPCLQVLTHPGLWQNEPMPTRKRVFRCAYGRARATISRYDNAMNALGRVNQMGKMAAIEFLRELRPLQYELYDYLWNTSKFQTLFLELWRLHEEQITVLCRDVFQLVWRVPAHEVFSFFSIGSPNLEGRQLFNAVFGDRAYFRVTSVDEVIYLRWWELRHHVALGNVEVGVIELELGCEVLCSIVRSLADWGRSFESANDGLTDSTEITVASQGLDPRWEALVLSLQDPNCTQSIVSAL